MRYKFDEIKELLFDKVVDCLIVSAQESEVLSIIRYRAPRRSLGNYEKTCFLYLPSDLRGAPIPYY
jgi:hypothetical protein